MPDLPTHSWYSVSAQPWPAQPPLTGDLQCDVCVVGAGYTGLLTALHLAERGYQVALLESHEVGWGASGRNGGQMLSGYHHGMAEIAHMVGEDQARQLWALAEEAKAEVRDRIARHQIACDLRPGHLLAALKPRHLEQLKAWADHMAEAYHYPHLELLGREQIRAAVASPAYIGGVLDHDGGHCHPLDYCRGLGRAALAAGVRIFEHTRVNRIEIGPRPVAITTHGRVQARWLALCGNAYLHDAAPPLRGWIMPAGTYMIATAPLGAERAAALVPCGAAVSDCNFVLDYFRLSADHRLLFGGGVSYSGFDGPALAARMRRRLVACFPQLADVAAEYCWGGHVAITRSRMPHFGRLSPSVFFAHGYSGQGLALTAIAGKLMAEAIAGSAERFDVFARLPHQRFPGGSRLRTPLLVLGMTWFRLRDLL